MATTDQGSEWAAEMAKMASLSNCYVKISGGPQGSQQNPWSVKSVTPFVQHAIKLFGPDRSLFAGNWFWILNFASLASWDDGLSTMLQDMSVADRQKIFSGTAEKFYRVAV